MIGIIHGPTCPLSMNGEASPIPTTTMQGMPSGGGTGRQRAKSELITASLRLVKDCASEPFFRISAKEISRITVMAKMIVACRSRSSFLTSTLHSNAGTCRIQLRSPVAAGGRNRKWCPISSRYISGCPWYVCLQPGNSKTRTIARVPQSAVHLLAAFIPSWKQVARYRAQPGSPPDFRSSSSISDSCCFRLAISCFFASILVFFSLMSLREFCSIKAFVGSV